MTPVRVPVELEPQYVVEIGPDVRHGVASAVRGKALTVIDARLLATVGATLAHVEETARFSAVSGESCKTFAELERLLSRMAEAGLDRASTLVAIGGGATLDLAGLAAALYMRGIASVYCPTTLLAMVDASVGGKTALNLPQGKNLVGTFHQPRAVFADTSFLATLEPREFASGLGETLKTALITGENALEWLERSATAVLAREQNALVELIALCVREKARIVASDEREVGPRKVLNLGHTFAHAIEHVAGYGVIPHGVAVAVGLSLAAQASESMGLTSDRTLVERIQRLLVAFHLPPTLSALRTTHELALDPTALFAAMKSDKKARDGRVRFVLPEGVGRIRCDVELDSDVLVRLLA